MINFYDFKANVQLSWSANENSIVDSHLFDAIARQLSVSHNNDIKEGVNIQMDVFSPYKSNILFLFNGIQPFDIDLKIGKNIQLHSASLRDTYRSEYDDDEYDLETRCYGFDFIENQYKQFFPSTNSVQDITRSTYFYGIDDIISVIEQHFPEMKDNIKMTNSLSPFYTEIASILRFTSTLSQSNSFANKLYFVGFRSIGSIKSQYGVDSSEFKNAVKMIKKTVDNLLSKLKHVYNDKVLSEAIFLPRIFDEHTEQCNRFKSMMTGHLHSNSVSIRDEDDKKNVTYGNYTIPDEIAEWHLFMWTWIGLAVVAFFAIYAMYTMDIGEDSLLYRTTNLSNKKLV